MTDTIKKLAIEWKEADKAMDNAKQYIEKPVNMISDVDFEKFMDAHTNRNACANVLAMAIAKELGL